MTIDKCDSVIAQILLGLIDIRSKMNVTKIPVLRALSWHIEWIKLEFQPMFGFLLRNSITIDSISSINWETVIHQTYNTYYT